MNYKTIIALIVLSLTLCSTSFAAKSKIKRKKPSETVRGKYTKGAGYQVRFNNNKNTYVSLSGLAGAKLRYAPDAESQPEHFDMDYFRLYLTLRTSKQWAAHASIWHSASGFSGAGSKIENAEFKSYGKSGLYLARAHVKYTPNKYLEFKSGRIEIAPRRFGYVSTYSSVSNGLKATLSFMNGTTVLQANYQNDSTRSSSTAPISKTLFLMARQNLVYKFTKSIVFDVGAGFMTGEEQSEKKYYDFVADFNLTLGKLYIANEFQRVSYDDDTSAFIDNYIEVGYQLASWFVPDVYYGYSKSEADGAIPTNSFGIESSFILKGNKKIIAAASLTRTNEVNTYGTSMSFRYYF